MCNDGMVTSREGWGEGEREGQFVFHNAEKSIRNVLVFVCFFLSRTSRPNNVGTALCCYMKTAFTWVFIDNHQVQALKGNRRGCRTNVSLFHLCFASLGSQFSSTSTPNYIISLTWSSRDNQRLAAKRNDRTARSASGWTANWQKPWAT